MNPLIKKTLLGLKPLKGKEINQCICLSSSSINQCWQIQLDNGEKFFAKTGRGNSFEMFQSEKKSLLALRTFMDTTLLEIPKPLALEKVEETSILLMPWLKFHQGSQSLLGEGLAKIHLASTANNPNKFGWDHDGFIGAGAQVGGWKKSWGECFVRLRLIPQINIARVKWGLKISKEDCLIDALMEFLNHHQPLPSLVHGDLWSGNAFTAQDGRGILLDPASWWADREVDLAMTKLFGGFSSAFYNSYQKVWPLDNSAELRIEIYNLYHLLNHANIFGGEYEHQCRSIIRSFKRYI